ncbi:hypothetical protein D1BOALGB6SA_4609 [Olavius sp. associated proteobacterium Delta 1]|nr:hypothetical protein D1BOALGB6SA_4609 [Olavius sp. associated proteobacterium Delta 1]
MSKSLHPLTGQIWYFQKPGKTPVWYSPMQIHGQIFHFYCVCIGLPTMGELRWIAHKKFM